ncbi:MAG TPA: carboxypeptidase-like regulatory domain-containing protein [Candidatus Dormibacteraeota bacterium]|nr:carboxypeptidase-like regulatory domain-containing protein [Candidatus Dormibacteraeota bacterium]
MPRRASLFATLAAFIGAFSPAAVPQQQFRIAGVVVDSVSGAPIERAEVTIAPAGNLGDASTTWSAPSGQFLFGGLPPGKYRLTASRVGYTQQGLDQHEGFMTAVAVGPKLDSEHIHFRLFRESVIAGTVLDEYGEPVRSADMFLFRRGFSGGAHTTDLAGRATADDLGVYRFPHLAPGTYFVVAYAKPWYASGSQVIDRVKASDVTILPRPARSIDVNDNDDVAAVDSAEVLPAPPPAPNPPRDVVYPLAFYINAGSLDSATPLTVGPGATVTADFSLHPVPALHLLVKAPAPLHDDAPRNTETGVVDFAANFPLAASLQLAGTELEQLPVRPAQQMPGYFEVTNVVPGEIQFRSIAKNERGISVQSTVQQVTSENRVDLSSSAAVSVSGTVNPLPFATIGGGDGVSRGQGFLSLTSADGRTTQASQITAKGEFSLVLPAGKYTVNLVPPAFAHIVSLQATGAAVSANSVTLSPGTSVKLNVRALQADATVSGTALKNGHPCAGAMIVLVPEDSTQSAALFHRDQSDSDGTFTMSPVFPGRYTLLAIENGWDLEWSKLSVLFSYLAAGVPLEVKPGANVSINVRVQ